MKTTREKKTNPFSVVATVALMFALAGSAAGSDVVAHWSFDEGAGTTAADSSGNDLHGTVVDANWTDGILGGALEFGPGSRVEILEGGAFPAAIDDLGTGSVSVWFKLDAQPQGLVLLPLVYLGDELGGSSMSAIVIEIGHGHLNSTKLFFTVYQEGLVPQCFDSDVNLSIDTWHHFVAVVGPDYNTGFLNGVEMDLRNYNYGGPDDDFFCADVVAEEVIWIGSGFARNDSTQRFFDGVIDEVQVFDGPLGADEVFHLRNGILNGGGPELIRGDTDGNGVFNALSDGTFLLEFGFLGGPPPPCVEASDADGDGTQNALSDALYILSHGFLGGAPPPPPHPDCGSDPDSAGSLGCDASPCP